MTDAEKEQITLRANYLNGIAIAILVLGMIAPVLAVHRTVFITHSSFTIDGAAASILSMAAAFITSRIAHESALSHLAKLQPSLTRTKADN